MATRNVLVEINLTSSDEILDISGDDHPLPIYAKYGVPVALWAGLSALSIVRLH